MTADPSADSQNRNAIPASCRIDGFNDFPACRLSVDRTFAGHQKPGMLPARQNPRKDIFSS